jgi:phosphoesterase RecJ-like protein
MYQRETSPVTDESSSRQLKPVPGGPDAAEDFELAEKALDEAQKILLMCHVAPDGDALGSMLAMKHHLEASGREVVATYPEPFVPPPSYRCLPGIDELLPPATAAEFQADLVMTFDCASRDRAGELAHKLDEASDVIVLDHHASNPRYGTINLVYPEASSSSEILYDFLSYLGAELNHPIATCLYVGIATDTGRFQYQNTSPRVFAICAELAAIGIDISSLSRKVFEETRLAVLKLLALVLQRAKLDAETGSVYSWLGYGDLEEFGVHAAETEDYIDVLRQTEEADVAFLVKELHPGQVKASIRSLGRVDVAAVAGKFGGGGHKMAAGFTSDVDVAQTIEAILEELRRWAPRASSR